MLTILVGSDTSRRAARLESLVSARSKAGADVRIYNDISFDPEELKSVAGSTSLFGGTLAIILSGIADRADGREALERLLPIFGESAHAFIVSESALLSPFLKKAEKSGASIEQFEEKTKNKNMPAAGKEAFNVFALSDAFSNRDKKMAWALYRKALSSGLDARELHGKFFWAAKTLLLAEHSSSAKESGLHPFVYGKAKIAAKNFIPGELKKISADLAALFHESFGDDLELSLESFVLRTMERPKRIS